MKINFTVSGNISKFILWVVSFLLKYSPTLLVKLFRALDKKSKKTDQEIVNYFKDTPEDAFYYLQGSVRYFLYQRWYLSWMVSTHIKEQFLYRLSVANRQCTAAGECVCCGCKTPALYFADKACAVSKYKACEEGLKLTVCYPEMVSAETWKLN
jgi:hypothetical protein